MTLYKSAYNHSSLKGLTFLVTGGAGFIGSNLVEYLLVHGASKVRVLDNLSNGFRRNVDCFNNFSAYEFIEGDITDINTCREVCKGVDLISHQAALGSVPRSIETPLATHAANVNGFLNLLIAARDEQVRKVVYASSSSVYGDAPDLPKREDKIGNPLSPYAVSKYTNELYASVFGLNYKMNIIGLRYFNVFGPRQDPNGPYAAAIPLFIDAILNDKSASIHGKGDQTRDFTFVANAVQANIRALMSENKQASGRVYNVAVGVNTTILDLYNLLCDLEGKKIDPLFKAERPGDIKHSLADISLARKYLDYNPQVLTKEGLMHTLEWFKNTFYSKPN
ncbi:MAG TPA: SDR family oxidoreductase [Bacteroidia bacterium]|nr:SDR family oxidoreductase [Bacteroidia bacterium]